MKDKTTAGVLALLLGGIGGHKFYLGQTGMGIIYLMFCWTFIPSFVAFIEGLVYLTMSQESFDAKYNLAYTPQLLLAQQQFLAQQQLLMGQQHHERDPQNIVVNVSGAQAAGGHGGDVVAQLKQLHELKLAGALTDAEFEREKQKLLGN